jgi:phage virion morphogenesis protein
MSSSGVSANWSGVKDIEYSLMLLQLSDKKKRRITGNIVRSIKTQTRKNIKNQSSVTGNKFKDRKRKRTLKGKMLSGFGRDKNFFVKTSAESAQVSWKGEIAGLAKIHQEGAQFKSKPRKMSRQKLEEMKGMMAQRWQARLMNGMGFKVANKDGGGKRGKAGLKKRRVSQAWIMQYITAFQAMIIIAKLREERGESGGKDIETKIPARHFFPNERAWLTELATQMVTKEFRKAGK